MCLLSLFLRLDKPNGMCLAVLYCWVLQCLDLCVLSKATMKCTFSHESRCGAMHVMETQIMAAFPLELVPLFLAMFCGGCTWRDHQVQQYQAMGWVTGR